MKKCINNVTIEGYVYQHSLEKKTVKDASSPNFGKEFINGVLEVATDELGLNVIPVHYTYVTALTKDGRENRLFGVLEQIIAHPELTWINGGKETAMKVRCSTSFGVNDFYAKDGQLVSQLIQEGGFINVINELSPESNRNTFSLDFLITNVAKVEADPEKNQREYCKVRGAGFNFRNALLPMTLNVYNPQGIDYFEDLGASNSNPVFLKVRGVINNNIVKSEVSEESAFGDAFVRVFEKRVKEWIITHASPTPYEFGDESVITFEDVQKAIQDREVYLATVKKRKEDWEASKAAGTAPAAQPAVTAKPSTALYNF